MNKLISSFAIILLVVISINTIPNIFAEIQTNTTSDGTLDVKLDMEDPQPGEETKLKIEFINPQTGKPRNTLIIP